MGGMAVLNWSDAPEIHPSEIRVGDVIGAIRSVKQQHYTVKMIGEPQKSPKQWTFFGQDDRGLQHSSTFSEADLVRRLAKAS
jgi:hypothetical protein